MVATGSAAIDSGQSGPTVIYRLDEIARLNETELAANVEAIAGELLEIGETALESWLKSRNRKIEDRPVEGFRLLGLHRQGAKGDPSFNACRETCRELVYRTNCARLEADESDIARHLKLGAMVARHLVLFIDGKLETEGLGEFCCSSRQLRANMGSVMPSDNEQE